MPPIIPWTARETYEARVNQSDFACDATLDTVFQVPGGEGERVVMRDPLVWKGEDVPARFEFRLDSFTGISSRLDRTQGRRYRMLIRRVRIVSKQRFGSARESIRFTPVMLDPLPVWLARFDFTRATVDTIVARSRFDTLFAQADLVVLARHAAWGKSDRDGKLVPSELLRIDRTFKGDPAVDTLAYQTQYGLGPAGRALLFLKRHGTAAWEQVWPGAGVHMFDARNREPETGLPLQHYLERLERVPGRSPAR